MTGNSGFPKSHNISKAIDREAGAEREVVGRRYAADGTPQGGRRNGNTNEGWARPWREKPLEEQGQAWVTAPATDAAATWEGYGSALKPAYEPCLIARKPRRATLAQTAVLHGSGALWIDGARVGIASDEDAPHFRRGTAGPKFNGKYNNGKVYQGNEEDYVASPGGRWPANLALVHDERCRYVGTRDVKGTDHGTAQGGGSGGLWKPGNGSPVSPGYSNEDGTETVDAWVCVEGCPVLEIGRQHRDTGNGYRTNPSSQAGSKFHANKGTSIRGVDDTGTAARFFYQAVPDRTLIYCGKSSPAERSAGLDEFPDQAAGAMKGRNDGSFGDTGPVVAKNPHPTVKPIDVARYIATLLLPPELYRDDAVLLIPFAGVMSEAIGALWAGWRNIQACEREEEYVMLGRARIAWWQEFIREYPTVKSALQAARKKGSTGKKGGRGGKKCDRPEESLPLFGVGV